MTPVEAVTDRLRAAGVDFVAIGASGMAVWGVVRATVDIDLLTTEARVLREVFWEPVRSAGLEVEIRWGDTSDPLVGVVSIAGGAGRPVDLVVGEAPWQMAIVKEGEPASIGGLQLPAATPAGLVLLKLYAGGPQDRWDIDQLLRGAPDRESLMAEISRRIEDLPPRCRALWSEILAT